MSEEELLTDGEQNSTNWIESVFYFFIIILLKGVNNGMKDWY